MKEDSYDFIKEPEIHYYEFLSEGSKGIIRKVIQFQQVTLDQEVYNIGFRDFNEDLGEIDDLSISNNDDTKKVLATVAKAIIDFITQHPKAVILAKGSSLSRTRLYQMGILQFWNEINTLFDVKGFYENDWVDFEKGKNYEAFFIVKRF